MVQFIESASISWVKAMMLSSMVRALAGFLIAALAMAAALTGCSAGMVDHLPESIGGLPADVPARPATPYQYPAVHDMPPPRSTTPMSEDEQLKLEKDLQAARDHQEGRPAPAKKAAAAPKKKPGDAESDQAAGAKTSGAKTNP
jgi:hypothetical protein